MQRLNRKAWQILFAEVEKCAAQDTLAGEVSRRIVINQLKLLRRQHGKPVDEAELTQIICDIFPNFSKQVLQKAAKINRSSDRLKKIVLAPIALSALTGLVLLVNLPYPMIRRPVAKVAPILLLPSYISMDRNYRGAIAAVEQADRLVNKATSKADFELGADKVKQAQKNLDALPVWFLGYEPQFYCRFFGCVWRFTYDEFETARASVGRMEAKIFQEKNAISELEKSEATVQKAKQDYQKASTPENKQQAIASWQEGIDELAAIPEATLGGRTAKTKLNAIQRDFQQISGLLVGSDRTNIIVAAAEQFAIEATQTCQTPPYPLLKWQACEHLWQEAIERLEMVAIDSPGYLQAQTLLATYQTNLSNVRIQKQEERTSEVPSDVQLALRTEADAVNSLKEVQSEIESLIAYFSSTVSSEERNRKIARIQRIIDRLETIQSKTTVYLKAQQLLRSARDKLNKL